MAKLKVHEAVYHVLTLRTKGLYLTDDAAYVRRTKQKGRLRFLSEWQGV